jgi:hypothetical protein
MTFSRQRTKFFSLLLLLFLFRIVFGLCSEFWYEDEKQIYLIGLKYYTTGAWPYFGPDVTYQIQIPGALQGLLVAIPLFILPIPESPFIFLNILSFFSLCLLAWYCTKRLPEIPEWFVWAWLMTAPWTLNYSTHVVNPSYVLAGSILFFVGFLETCPYTSKNLISSRWVNFVMGLSLFWVMQLHMSWVVMLPYVLASFYFQLRAQGKDFLVSLAWFFLGSALTGSLLLPTFFKYGVTGGLGGTDLTAALNLDNLQKIFSPTEGILPRFLSFSSFEIARFMGGNSARRFLFISQQPWLIPFILFLGVVGILQPIAMLILWFSRTHTQQDWKAIKYLTLFTVLLLYVSFLFSVKLPSSHTFYVTLPIAMIYGFYCWSDFLKRPKWRKFSKVLIACGIIFHVGLAIHNFFRVSLYVDRNVPRSAIKMRDFHILGERRPEARY